MKFRPTRNGSRRFAWCALAGVVALAATGCGGDDDGADEAPSATSAATTPAPSSVAPSTTAAVSSTAAPAVTTAPSPTTEAPATTPSTEPIVAPPATEPPATTSIPDTTPVDTESEQLALAFTLQSGDFADPWTVYEAASATDSTFDECSVREGGAVTRLTKGAAQRGPVMQFGQEAGFVSSVALAFPDEATALEYIGLVNTDVFAQCTLEKLQEFMDTSSPDVKVSLDATTEESVGTDGFERYILMSGSTTADGLVYLNELAVYRIGRVVVRVTHEYGGMTEETKAQIDEDAYQALSNAYTRVNELI